MKKFNLVCSRLLKEFNVQDRNDPSFYDYVVVLLQQIRQKNLTDPNKLSDLRKTAMEAVRKSYYNFIDEKSGVSQKIEFIFKGGKDSTKNIENQSSNNLIVKISSIPPTEEEPKTIENTYEESSIEEIVNHLEDKKIEAQNQKEVGVETPAQVGETPSALPGGAEQPADTSQYLKGL